MKKERAFNKTEMTILRVLYQQKIPLTIYEVAKDCGISYPTSKKYLEKLSERYVILDSKLKKKPNKFTFNYALLDKSYK